MAARTVYRVVGRGLTYTYFAFSLIWFWSNWKEIDAMYSRLGIVGMLEVWVLIFVVATVVLAAWEEVRARLLAVQWDGEPALSSLYARAAWSSGLTVLLLAVTLLARQSAPDIVYKAF